MKKIVSMILTLTLLVLCAVCFASCGAPEDDGPEISVYLGERVYDFDPTDYFVDSNAEQIMSLLYDPLFYVNEDGKLKLEGAADDYDVDEDERTIVITLKETYWSDSEPVKPDDFIYAWRSILLEPTEANPAAALLYDIENAWEIKCGNISPYELGAKKTGDYELTITYREGADYKQLLKNLATVASAPVRQDIITELNSGYWSKLVNSAVTNGPFCIGEINEEENYFTLARSIGYHQALDVTDYTDVVRPGKLISFIDPVNGETNLTYSDIENKTVFYMADASLDDRAANKDKAMVSDDLSTYTYVFNMENPLFANVKVRQALSMVIDRNEIINKITFGKAATGFIPPAVLDTNTGSSFGYGNLISASAKVDEAKELIKDVDFGGIEKKFTLTVNDDEESVAIAEIAIKAWKELGFTVTLDKKGAKVTDGLKVGDETLKFSDSAIQVAVNDATRGEKNFDVIAVDWQMYSTDAFVALSAFASDFSGCGVELPLGDKKYGSFGGYVDAKYDKLIEAAYNTNNKGDRSGKLHDAEAKLVESACIIPLVFNQNFAFISRDLSKIEFDGFGNFVLTDTKQKNYRDYLE